MADVKLEHAEPPAIKLEAGGAGSEDDDDDDDGDDDDYGDEGGEDAAAAVSEKLYLITSFLKSLPNHPFVSFTALNDKVGVDLHLHEDVLKRLRENGKIVVDDENEQLRFQPRFEVHDVASLVQALNKFPDGISANEVLESAPGMQGVIHEAIVTGLIIALRNKQPTGGESHLVLFPRGPTFLVPLSGTFVAEPEKAKLVSSADVREEVHRGDAVVIGQQGVDALDNCDPTMARATCVRVSLDPEGQRVDGETDLVVEHLSHLPTPYSRSSSKEPRAPKAGEYKRKFMENKLPVTPVFRGPAPLRGEAVFKHGCTNDVRAIWTKACQMVKYAPQQQFELDQELLKNNLVDEAWLKKGGASGIKKRAPRAKKRRAGRRITKLTNAHLED